ASASAFFAHTVTQGESLTSIAAADGLSVAQLAAANGLPLNAFLIDGSTVQIPPQSSTLSGLSSGISSTTATSSVAASTSSSGSTALPVSTTLGATAETQPVGGSAQGNPTAPPYPTPERLSASQIASVAAAHGVPPALADAIAWQESGFNNDLVSSADARGIMQILPGTWQWIQNSLNTGPALAPASAVDNVRGGVLLLRSLLGSTGGDPALAAAGYYQGLP